MLLEEKVALVTGSGRGIGAAAASLFAGAGANVVVSDLDLEPAQQTVEKISTAGGRAIVVAGDVTDPAFPAHLVKATLDAFGGLDIIVNNAGYTWDATIGTMTDQQWYAMVDVHMTGPFRLLRAASPFLVAAAKKELAATGTTRPRKVINVSSVSGVYGTAGQANYAAAKAGIIGLSKTLAKEWGRYNVQVNCVCYSFIQTRLIAGKDQARTIQRFDQEISLGIPERTRAAALFHNALGRFGTPEEAAGPMLFLASPLSDYVSGQVLEVTGGPPMM